MLNAPSPAALGFAMPAEWERHERTLMAWPCRGPLWGSPDGMRLARAAYAGVARAIAAFEPVTMLARPEDAREAERQCGAKIEILAMPLDDSWVRDSGPFFLTRMKFGHREIMGENWHFNGWGGKYPDHADDDRIPERVLSHLAVPRLDVPLVLEGGAVVSDGEGTLYTTEECLLNPNRNPQLARREVEVALCDYLGLRRIVWMPWGLEDDETDGHIDNVAALAAPARVMLNWTRDMDDPNAVRMNANKAALVAARDAAGRTIEVVELPQPKREIGWNGHRLPLSYLNFYIVNGSVIAPSFDDPFDKEAERILAAAFPDREIVQVPARDILPGGGGIHCITHEVPAGVPAEMGDSE